VIQLKLAAITGPASLAKRLSLLQVIPNFLPGVIAFVLPHSPKIKSFLWPIFIFILVGTYAAIPAEAMGWALCLILGFGIPCFGEIQTNSLRVVSNRIATYSYGIYLSHQFCIWYVDDPLGAFSWRIKIPVLTLLLVGSPILLYHFIEKPLIRVGADLAAKCSARTLAKSDVTVRDRVTRT
jgi:peptidoglycan/LPS O-acetylase OafA/YrhL